MPDGGADEYGLVGDIEADGRSERHLDLAGSEFGLDGGGWKAECPQSHSDRFENRFDPIETVFAEKIPPGMDVLELTVGSDAVEVELEFEPGFEHVAERSQSGDGLRAKTPGRQGYRFALKRLQVAQHDCGALSPGQ